LLTTSTLIEIDYIIQIEFLSRKKNVKDFFISINRIALSFLLRNNQFNYISIVRKTNKILNKKKLRKYIIMLYELLQISQIFEN